MLDRIEIRFRVRVNRLRLWEKVFVVGSHEALGSWLPQKAMQLEKSGTDSDLYIGSVFVGNTIPSMQFRYFVGSYLDSATENSKKLLVVCRWESLLNPRCILPVVECRNGIAREGYEDIFGSYDGKFQISDGWIVQKEEQVVFLRIHGEALKFYKSKYKSKEHRLKVVAFDVRFREIFSYEKHTQRGMLWRESSLYGPRTGSVDDEPAASSADAEPEPILPDHPSFSVTEIGVLTREDPIYGEQYSNGSVFRNKQDYLVFRTRTVSLEHLAFRIELYHESVRVGVAYALPAALPDTYGKTTFPIISTQQMPIGQVDVDYMLVKALPVPHLLRDIMVQSWGRYWRKRKTLEIGHRGMGSSYTKAATARENTVHSMNTAANRGADFVEFDVQLTKDMQAVIYHDFHVLVQVTSRNSREWTDDDTQHKHHQLAVKDMRLAQLHLLHLEHVGSSKESTQSLTPRQEESSEDLHPFPSLTRVLKAVDAHVGFNIEVKYPMMMQDGSHECAGYFERNTFVDVILKDVFENAGMRRIIFSSFDPDICTLISQKQHRYPVLFLVVGATTRYVPFEDIRSDCSKMAVNFAAGANLLGVNFHSEELLKDPSPLRRAEKFNLVSFVWGDDLNIRENADFFKNQLKVDAIIYDRIGEDITRQNIFRVEQSAKSALFERSTNVTPSVSRRGSLENIKDTATTLRQASLALPSGESRDFRRAPPHPVPSESIIPTTEFAEKIRVSAGNSDGVDQNPTGNPPSSPKTSDSPRNRSKSPRSPVKNAYQTSKSVTMF